MKITRAVDYGMRGVLYMSMQPEGQMCLLSEICKEQGVPQSFMAKIFQSLSRARIIKSYRGVKGGFALARPPKDISMKEVMEAIEGPMNINICVSGDGDCHRENFCPATSIWKELQESIEDVLNNCSFEDLARKGKKLLEVR